jgi:hypothetical protein
MTSHSEDQDVSCVQRTRGTKNEKVGADKQTTASRPLHGTDVMTKAAKE